MNERAEASGPTAGWYPDPDQPQTQRYWTGTEWTEQRAPLAVAEKKRDSDLTFGVLLGIAIPIAGFLYGLWLLARGNGNGGWVMVCSVFAAFAWLLVLAFFVGLSGTA